MKRHGWSLARVFALGCALAFGGVACDRKAESTSEYVGKPDSQAAAAAESASSPGSPLAYVDAAPAAASAAPAEQAFPSESKAERKADREITNANYKAELNKLEKEIGGP